MDSMEVRLYGRRVATLERVPLTLDEFALRYDPDYARNPGHPPLSGGLALREAPYDAETTRRWFDGLLPEGPQRDELASLHGLHRSQTWALLRRAGAECAGAVQIVPQGHRDRPAREAVSEREIGTMLRQEMDRLVPHRQALYRAARVSLAGAQPKIALHRDADGAWSVATGGAPSTHILKPESGAYTAMVGNEHWCMTTARWAGLDVARTEVAEFDGVATLIVERYDRTRDGRGQVRRIHQEDLVQALGLRAIDKYQGEPDAVTTEMLASVKGVDEADLFDQIMVSWLLGNWDAHAKNYSVLEPGTARARLSPGYDLMSVECYRGEAPKLAERMGTAIGDALRPSAVGSEDVDTLGARLGLAQGAAQARTQRLSARLAHAIAHARESGLDSGPVDVQAIEGRIAETLDWWGGAPNQATAWTEAEQRLAEAMIGDGHTHEPAGGATRGADPAPAPPRCGPGAGRSPKRDREASAGATPSGTTTSPAD